MPEDLRVGAIVYLIVGGSVLVVTGCAFIYVPLAIIITGFLMIGLGMFVLSVPLEGEEGSLRWSLGSREGDER